MFNVVPCSVPPSPLEPDPESEASETELKLIPLMEVRWDLLIAVNVFLSASGDSNSIIVVN